MARMTDWTLTEDECAAFGLTVDQAKSLSDWVLARVGYVVGRNGRGGSGVFVEAPNGRTALLTARHVLIPAVISGDVSVAFHDDARAYPVEFNALRMARRADAALVFLADGARIPRLTVAEWDPRGPADVTKGMGIVAAGAPGEWKSEPDVVQRVIKSMKTLLFWTAVTEPNRDGLIVCDVDGRIKSLPSTFRGMSGGPVFDSGRRLVGINKGEFRGAPDGMLFATPRKAWMDLFYPFEPPGDMPTDYTRQLAGHTFLARHENAPTESPPVAVGFACEYFWSATKAEHRFGEFGRIYAATFGSSPEASRYVVNVESLFNLPPGHDDASRRAAFEEEARYMLESMRYRIV
jgi:hypothetical protein